VGETEIGGVTMGVAEWVSIGLFFSVGTYYALNGHLRRKQRKKE